ncbi:DUF302 domain-containing protein [Paraglaciecola sp. 2405UD69-4]|uniref:DUF302 domain-containing protein n=1 Tax=Paraglaciecola sp. 2405UD69-4 TaxID=3391836 RepID=UPI0039C8CDC5
MNKFVVLFLVLMATSVGAASSEGVIRYESPYSVSETMARFEKIVADKGFTVFSVIDHQQNAAKVGLDLPATQVILFGNPKVGTLLMQCAQNVAIDLPQKVMVAAVNGKVWLSYNDPEYLKKRHQIKGCEQVITKISGALGKFAQAAIAK